MRSASFRAGLAEKFGGKSEEGGQHVLGDALYEFGVGVIEVVVPLLFGQTEDVLDTHQRGGVGALENDPEIALQLRDFGEQMVLCGPFDAKQRGIFNGLDIESGGSLSVEAGIIAEPPVVDGELDDLFGTTVGEGIEPEDTPEDKVVGGTDLAFFQEPRLFFDLLIVGI